MSKVVSLKGEVDRSLRRVFYLTNAIRQFQELFEQTQNKQTQTILIETLHEYKKVSSNTTRLLRRYLWQERQRTGATPLYYYRKYRELGEEYE